MPFTAPSSTCCARNHFCEKCTTHITMATDTGSVSSVTPVSGNEIESIITSTPMTCVMLVTSCEMDWLSEVPSVSTSFVMRLSTSPLECSPKYDSGTTEILRAISPRRR